MDSSAAESVSIFVYTLLSRARGTGIEVCSFFATASQCMKEERTDGLVSQLLLLNAREMLFFRLFRSHGAFKGSSLSLCVLVTKYNGKDGTFLFPQLVRWPRANLIRHPRLDFVFRQVGRRRLTLRIKIQTE
jgi:hypothetical protein